MFKIQQAIVFFLGLFTTTYAQINSAEYAIKISDVEIKNSSLSEMYKIAQANVDYVSFQLKFNKDKSEFSIIDNLELEENTIKLVKIFSKYKGKIFIENDSVYSEKEIDNKDYILISNFNFEWEVTNENKKIGNYVCYKAIGEQIVTNKTNIIHLPITAWFCPEIPFQFGPNGFGKLPGLIFELQVDSVTYGLKSLKMNENKLKFSKIDTNKIISKEKYDEIINKNNLYLIEN